MSATTGPRRRPGAGARAVIALAAFAAVVAVACAPEDPSPRFSPSAQTLLGEATGERVLWPEGEPPPDTPAADGWNLGIELARFGELENRLASLEVLLEVGSRPGATLEMWLTSADRPRALWRGGDTRTYSGVTCWQIPLVDIEDPAVALELPDPGPYTLTVAFRDGYGRLLAADSLQVTHFIPELEGEAPGPGSIVFRDLLGCRRAGR